MGAILCLTAAGAHAACQGDNLIAGLSESDRVALAAAAAEHPYPEGNLWRASKPGSTVHVVGTVHIPDPRLDPILRRATPWVESADLLILEATGDMQAELQRRMAESPEIAFLTEGPTLIDLLGDEAWQELAEDLTARGIPPFFAARFRPWLLAMTLAIPECAIDALASGKRGLDGRLEAVAGRAGIRIATLDDIDTVIGLLGAGPLEDQVEMLRVMLMTEQDQEAIFATTLDSYFAGRHRELWEFSRFLTLETDLDDPAAAFASFEETLLDQRNADWEVKLRGLLPMSTAVIAVGAAHLSGETGVLRALERMGYRLTRL